MRIASKHLVIGKAAASLERKLTTRPMGSVMSLMFWFAFVSYILISASLYVLIMTGELYKDPIVVYTANISTLLITVLFSALSWIRFSRKAGSLLKNREHLIKSDLSRKIISTWCRRRAFSLGILHILIPIFLVVFYCTVSDLTQLIIMGSLNGSASLMGMGLLGLVVWASICLWGLLFALDVIFKIHTAKAEKRFSSLPELVQRWATHRAQQAGVSFEGASFMLAATKEYNANKKKALAQAHTLQNSTLEVSPLSPATRRRL